MSTGGPFDLLTGTVAGRMGCIPILPLYQRNVCDGVAWCERALIAEDGVRYGLWVGYICAM